MTDTLRDASPGRSALRGWAGVCAVAAATFTVVTSEMLPVGMLTPIGRTLQISEGTAGLTLTVTGLVAAASAPLITPAAGRLDRRVLLWALMLLLAVGDLMAAMAGDFILMMAGRVLIGLAMGGVWPVAASLAPRLLPAKSAGTGAALVFSGVAVASVLGVPAGTYLGQVAGWRTAFAAAGLAAVAVAFVLAALLPRLPAERAVRLGALARLAGERDVRTGLVATALLVTGHFAAYTYVRPVLERISSVDGGLIGTLLLVYGLAGVAGNFAGGAGAARSPRRTLPIICAALAAAVLLFPELGRSPASGAALLVVWGLAYGGVSVTTQAWLSAAARQAREAASALFVGVFNAAIAFGALVGGRTAEVLGIAPVMWVAGALAAAALLTVLPRPGTTARRG
ncbi:MFS transporter [Microbispora sp. CA-102843]|uniref:MFS transporter n=1 Tax=Microbispora sp. CA-102843 TaxID=3239952 RepID=UPI003D8B35AD